MKRLLAVLLSFLFLLGGTGQIHAVGSASAANEPYAAGLLFHEAAPTTPPSDDGSENGNQKGLEYYLSMDSEELAGLLGSEKAAEAIGKLKKILDENKAPDNDESVLKLLEDCLSANPEALYGLLKSEEAAEAIEKLKEILDESKSLNDEELGRRIGGLAEEYGVKLTQADISRLLPLLRTLETVDAEKLLEQADELAEAADKFRKFTRRVLDTLQKIKDFLNKIVEFFKRLFGKQSA